jgi:hypothetical protein
LNCYNGGTCSIDDSGKASCQCIPGYDPISQCSLGSRTRWLQYIPHSMSGAIIVRVSKHHTNCSVDIVGLLTINMVTCTVSPLSRFTAHLLPVYSAT